MNPAQMGGVACIRGLRIPVATVVGMVADGMSTAEILDAYPDLDCNDIQLLKNLPAISAALQEGSIVVFDQLRIRVRPLPVSGND